MNYENNPLYCKLSEINTKRLIKMLEREILDIQEPKVYCPLGKDCDVGCSILEPVKEEKCKDCQKEFLRLMKEHYSKESEKCKELIKKLDEYGKL